MNPSIFERNPKKTLLIIVLLILFCCDIVIERLLDRNNLLNTMLHKLNANLAYKVEIWQHRKQNSYYHHGLEPMQDITETWGVLRYRLTTNSLGFKDAAKREVSPYSGQKRILFIGDSFTEGLGVPYEKTFAGLVGQRLGHVGYEVLNAGVVSYSPKIYYHKVKYLLEQKHLKINELYVFIDISDIYNELEYEIFEPIDPRQAGYFQLVRKGDSFLQHNSFFYNVARYYYEQQKQHKSLQSLSYLEKHREETGFWTLDEKIYQEWGERGVRLAERHMRLLADLCKANGIKMTIAVYPWQSELIFGNRHSKQISIWRDFAAANAVGFINYYPDFFEARIPGIPYSKVKPYDIINTFFIPGDIHWNEAGHRLIADKIRVQ